jgi:hypothetical protein
MARFAGTIDEKTQDFEGSAIAYVRKTPHDSKPSMDNKANIF